MVFLSLPQGLTKGRFLAAIGLALLAPPKAANAQTVAVQQRILAEGSTSSTGGAFDALDDSSAASCTPPSCVALRAEH